MKPLEITRDEGSSFRVLEGARLQHGVIPGDSGAQETEVHEERAAGDVQHEEAPRGLSLRVNFSWTLAGNIIYAGCQWAMLVVLARLGRTEMVGQFALGLAITAPVLMCANLNLRAVQATDARREYEFSDYLSLRILTTALALPVIAGITFFSGYRDTTLAVILLLGLSKCLEALSDIFYGFLQQNERMRPIAISMMLKGVLSLTALAAILFLTGSLTWAVAALCIVWALILALYDAPQSFQLRNWSTPEKVPRRKSFILPQVAARLAWLAAPMGVVMFLISLNGNIPRYFIERQIGLHELGIFAAITYLMTAGGTVVGALGQSATPRLSTLYAKGERAAFSALLLKLAAISTVIGIAGLLVAALFGRPLLGLLYGAEYSAHTLLFVVMMAVAWLSYLGSLLGYGMSAARCFRVQAPIYFASLLATLAGCVLLIPRFELVGAALAMGAGVLVQIAAGMLVTLLAIRENAVTAAEGSA